MKKVWRFLGRLTVIDWLIGLALLFGAIFLILFVSKQEKWVTVEAKIIPEQWWWEVKYPPYWLVDQIKKGDVQYDSLGKKMAEVLEVKSYEWLDMRTYERSGGRKITYLTLRLKAGVEKRQGKLTFNYRPLEIGKPVELSVAKVGLKAVVNFIEGIPDGRVWEEKVIEARVIDSSEIFPETLGVQPWIAEAISVGSQMKDSQGKVIAEVLEKKVTPAQKIVITDNGRAVLTSDPLKKDILLVLRLLTQKQEGVNYFLYDFKVKVDGDILLALPNIDVFPKITKVIK